MQDGRVGEGKVGVAFLASRSGAPVIPAAIVGAHKAMPVGAAWPRFCPIHVVFGSPLVFESGRRKPSREELDRFADRVMRAITDLGASSGEEADGAGLDAAEEGSA